MAGPGATAPATVAPQKAGMQMQGRIKMSIAMKLMTDALGMLGAEGEEGRVILGALADISKAFGEAGDEVSRQEAKMIMDRTSPVSAPSPESGQAFGDMARARLGSLGLGGNGGAPAMQPAA